MKILFYTNAFDGGGAEIVFARLATALAEVGHDVIFAADHAEPIGVTGPNPRYERLPADHAGATRALAALLRQEKPDASFSALGAHNVKHVAAAAAAGRLRHCVLGIHGFAAAEPKRLSQLSYWGAPLMTRLAARTICVSDVLKGEMIRTWRASQTRLVRIYNPLGPAGTVDTGKRDDPPLILACGRFAAIKRFPDLVEAFADVAPREARLAILGEGDARGSIEAAVRRHHLEHRVDLPGHVDPAPWYSRASCLAVTSASESFGLTIAEALSHGVPVVSTDCGGPREILADGAFGRLVPVGDRTALTQALSETLADPGDPAFRIERARAFALTTIRDAYASIARSLA